MKTAWKALAGALSWVLVAPGAFCVRLLAPLDRRHSLFQFGSHCISLLPGLPGAYLRKAYYAIVLGCPCRGLSIGFGTVLAQRGITFGSNVYIGSFCNVGLCAIEDDVLIGSGVHIISGRHVHSFDRTDVPIRLQGGSLKQIRIGEGSWLGNGAIVMEDVGAQCIIGAGAVVPAPCEPFGIYVGNPAKLVRQRGIEGESH